MNDYKKELRELVKELFQSPSLWKSSVKCSKEINCSSQKIYRSCSDVDNYSARKELLKTLKLIKENRILKKKCKVPYKLSINGKTIEGSIRFNSNEINKLECKQFE